MCVESQDWNLTVRARSDYVTCDTCDVVPVRKKKVKKSAASQYEIKFMDKELENMGMIRESILPDG
jgi:hypothetical protein